MRRPAGRRGRRRALRAFARRLFASPAGHGVAVAGRGLSGDRLHSEIRGAGGLALSRKLDVEDWRRARAALATALDPQGNGSAVAWDNPQSGRRGSFIPVAAPYPADGQVCRAFIAKIDAVPDKEVVQGAACRVAGTDDWDVKDLKPFKQS